MDLVGAVRHSGWENVVLETRDGWILRFPREHVDFDRELAILGRLADRLPVPIPRVEWTGRKRTFAAYRKLVGSQFDPTAYAEALPSQRDALAASLAEFLVAMHCALSPAEVRELGIPGGDDHLVVLPWERIPEAALPAVRRVVHDFESIWIAERVPGPDVLLHNDFHFWNMVLDGPVGRVTGVWDFSCVQLGKPSFDLRYLVESDLADRIAAAYEARTGVPMDLGAAVIAHRFELICDRLELDQPDELVELTQGWDT